MCPHAKLSCEEVFMRISAETPRHYLDALLTLSTTGSRSTGVQSQKGPVLLHNLAPLQQHDASMT